MTTVLQIENLSKEYRLGIIGHGTLRADIESWWARYRGLPDPNLPVQNRLGRSSRSSDRIWALRDVNLKVREGEAVGIIGKNGAGKSTLLKIISRVTSPTKGTVKAKGRIASLLEVGTGFHAELTGRENIYLNGTILGMTVSEINRKFDAILDFAGVEEFIDTPVKRYSSGMSVRLGFAVAAHLEPEILLVDEVLAVGDVEFQRKCLGKMNELSATDGRTILFVSHNMTAIRNLCGRALLIEDGEVAVQGEAPVVVDRYLEQQVATATVLRGSELDAKLMKWYHQGKVYFECKELSFQDPSGETRATFLSTEEIVLSITLEVFQAISNLQILAHLMSKDNDCLWRTEFADDPESLKHTTLVPGIYRFRCIIPRETFGDRTLYLTITMKVQDLQDLAGHQILPLNVEFVGYNKSASADSKYAYFRPRLTWKCDELTKEQV